MRFVKLTGKEANAVEDGIDDLRTLMEIWQRCGSGSVEQNPQMNALMARLIENAIVALHRDWDGALQNQGDRG